MAQVLDDASDALGDANVVSTSRTQFFSGQPICDFTLKRGDLSMVQFYVDGGADVNAVVRQGSLTALQMAADRGHLKIAEFLLDNGADVNMMGQSRKPPLYYACKHGHLEMVKVLLRRGADIDALNTGDSTVLFGAVESGSIELVSMLLKDSADVQILNYSKETLLYAAKDLDMVEFLIARGVKLRDNPPDASRLLVEAASELDLDRMQFFLQHGADVNASYRWKERPMYYAASKGNVQAIKLLLEHGADTGVVRQGSSGGVSALYVACEERRTAAVKCLLDHGVDVNAQSISCRAAILYDHVHGPNHDTHELLFEAGATFDGTSESGISHVERVVEFGRTDTLQLLVSRGADLFHEDSDGCSLVDHVYTAEMTEYLLTQGLKIGRTVLFKVNNEEPLGRHGVLLAHGHTDQFEVHTSLSSTTYSLAIAVRGVCEHGLDVNATVLGGGTLLHHCAKRMDPALIEMLIDHGADVNLTNENDETPLHLAAAFCEPSTAECLIQHGANVNAVDKDGWTPLGRVITGSCRSFGHFELVRYKRKEGHDIAYMLCRFGAQLEDPSGMIPSQWSSVRDDDWLTELKDKASRWMQEFSEHKELTKYELPFHRLYE